MKIIDIGCNLASPRLLPHLIRILDDAQHAGVIAQIITGSDAASNETALELAERYPELYATAGFHPHHANDWKPHSHPLQLQTLAQSPRCVAIGEMGLDYFRNLADPRNQRRCFIDQLTIAKTTQKPVFLHERNAYQDFSAILTEALPELTGAVWHCFTGNRAQMEAMADSGLYFGITGWICDPERGVALREVVRHIPADRLMIESDAPYLTPKTLNPVPRCNEPQYLLEVLRMVAQCRNEAPEETARQTRINSQRFFNLPTD
ncbi:MAG: TatD family hydrolase [Cardiobacteriaceae bacterium]|nr:TatD family hydrolase [Cardiobacteriaceae bacterium]